MLSLQNLWCIYDTYLSNLIFICTIIDQLETYAYIANNNLLLEAICCSLQMCNIVAPKEMVSETCVPSLIIIDNTIKLLVYH